MSAPTGDDLAEAARIEAQRLREEHQLSPDQAEKIAALLLLAEEEDR